MGFPQITGLGYSETARYYAIKSMEEAKAYMEDYTFGTNLIEISQALLEVESNDADEVMGWPDNLKLKSSMTLFALAKPECEVFQKVLDIEKKTIYNERIRKEISGTLFQIPAFDTAYADSEVSYRSSKRI